MAVSAVLGGECYTKVCLHIITTESGGEVEDAAEVGTADGCDGSGQAQKRRRRGMGRLALL